MRSATALGGSPLLSTWRQAARIADLADVFDPAVQVCTWRRELDPAITVYLTDLEQGGTLQTLETLTAQNRPHLPCLPAGPGRAALIGDLAILRDIVQELLGCPAVGLRLARVRHAMCPGWHIDQTGIRLVCTYQGPGTQWLDDQSTERRNLPLGRMEEDAFLQAAPGEIVLLKGSLWQGIERLGAVHPSPVIAGGASLRTVVTLDPLWQA